MTLADFQTASIRLYTDALFLERAAADPLNELARYGLSEAERCALIELVRARKAHLRTFGDGLHRKAFTVQWSKFHLVRDYFGAFKDDFYAAFRRSHGFARTTAQRAADEFAELLIATARNGEPHVPACFSDVVRYDHACTRIAANPGIGSLVDEFEFEVSRLRSGVTPDALPRGAFAYIFAFSPDTLTVSVYRQTRGRA